MVRAVAAQPPIVTVEYLACKANASHIVRVHVRTYIYTHSVLDSVYMHVMPCMKSGVPFAAPWT